MVDKTPRLDLDDYDVGDAPWDHSDLVTAVDEHAIARGPIADRPASGDYDDEMYYAVDQQLLWRWDADASDWVGVSGKGSESQPLPGTVHREAVNAESARITDATDITVNVPSDYNTVQDAFDNIRKQKVPHGSVINVNIESGHEFTPLKLSHGDFSHMRITSDDAVVPIDTSVVDSSTRVIGITRSIAPVLATKIDAQNTCARGLSVGAASFVPKLEDESTTAGVINVDGVGLRPGSSSCVSMEGADFSGCNTGLSTWGSSVVFCVDTDFSGASTQAIAASRGSSVSADGADLSGAGGAALRATNAAVVSAQDANITNADTAVDAAQSSIVHIDGADLSGAADDAIEAREAAVVNASGVTATGAGNRGLLAYRGAQVYAGNGDFSNATNEDVFISTGAIVSLDGATTTNGSPDVGDTNQSSFNSISSDGILFA